MLLFLRTVAWLACVVYSTIPTFWLLIHPRAEYWRSRARSPYRVLGPLGFALGMLVAFITARWRSCAVYVTPWTWVSAILFFALGLWLYLESSRNFSLQQLGGIPEVNAGHAVQSLVTTGIRGRIRHPVYLGHLCEMLAWSIGSGLAVCFVLTGFAVASGAIMIRMEDAELERRFGGKYEDYRKAVPAVLPRLL